MSTVTLTPAEAGHLARARAILRTVLNIPWPDDRDAQKAIGEAVWGVQDALDIHAKVADGSLHWEANYRTSPDTPSRSGSP